MTTIQSVTEGKGAYNDNIQYNMVFSNAQLCCYADSSVASQNCKLVKCGTENLCCLLGFQTADNTAGRGVPSCTVGEMALPCRVDWCVLALSLFLDVFCFCCPSRVIMERGLEKYCYMQVFWIEYSRCNSCIQFLS